MEKIANIQISKNKELILEVLNDRLYGGLEILGILKEDKRDAFVTAIENGEDVNDTAFEISKEIAFTKPSKKASLKVRILNISKTLIQASISVANERCRKRAN